MKKDKYHYAVHGNTAAEVIYTRADSNKPFMRLTNFKGELPGINDIEIAKNYLCEEELMMLNNLVSGYFDFAEFQAMKHKPMKMKDYINQLDKILNSLDAEVLTSPGKMCYYKDEFKLGVFVKFYMTYFAILQGSTYILLTRDFILMMKEVSLYHEMNGGVQMNQLVTGKFITLKRKQKNLTQEQLAEKLGVSNKTISKWETGKCMPDYSIVKSLCEELGVTVAELMDGEISKNNSVRAYDDEQILDLLRRTQELEKQKNMLYGIMLVVMGIALQALSYAFNGSNLKDFISGLLLGLSIAEMLIGIYVIGKSLAGR